MGTRRVTHAPETLYTSCHATFAIAAYLGSGPAFDVALGEFAQAYADQNEDDYQALTDAIRSGRVVAETGM